MNSFSIALKMFKANLKTYGYYLAVMIFAVAVYYEFMVLKYDPNFLKAKDIILAARSASSVTSFVLIVFLFFFMWYSSSFFLKQRKKEIAVYSLMGISTRRIGTIFAIESLFTGIFSVLAGMVFGILFSRLFMMAVARVALLDVTIGFSIPKKGIIELLVVFGAILLVLSVYSFVNVVRSKLIDLIRDSQKEEREPRFKAVRAVLSILLIAGGYYLSSQLILALLVVAMVVLGTYWLFGALLPTIAKFLTGKKAILYKGVRLISISNLTFRIKGNYRSLAMLAVMTATTITAFGTSLSLKYYIVETHHLDYPYSFSYVLNDNGVDKKVKDTIKASQHQLLLEEKIEFFEIDAEIERGLPYDAHKYLVIKYSDFARVSAAMEKHYPGKVKKFGEISGKELIMISPPAVINGLAEYEDKTLLAGNSKYIIRQKLKTPLFGKGGMRQTDCMVLPDEEYESLAKGQKLQIFHGYIVSDAKNSVELSKSLMKIVPEEAKFFMYAARYMSNLAAIGLIYFLGSFMSIVFIFATGSIMYFKILSEALADKGKYDILRKIGMSRREVRSAVSLQVGLSLILPLAVGIIHSLFAINVLSNLLEYSLMVPTLTAIIIYALFYGAFYIATTRKFMKMVYGG